MLRKKNLQVTRIRPRKIQEEGVDRERIRMLRTMTRSWTPRKRILPTGWNTRRREREEEVGQERIRTSEIMTRRLHLLKRNLRVKTSQQRKRPEDGVDQG